MKKRICAYCGKPGANSRDHVIPREIYSSSYVTGKIQRLTVPACDACNSSFRFDETAFCTYVALGSKRTCAADEIAFGKGYSKLFHPRNRWLRAQVARSLCEVDLFTQSGLWVKREPAFAIPLSFSRTLYKITRGLYFHHMKHVVPSHCSFNWFDWDNSSIQTMLTPLLKDYGKYEHRQPEIFEYLYTGTIDRESGMSVWVMSFLQSVTFVGIIDGRRNLVNPAVA